MLNLTSNQIKTLPTEIFQGLESLRALEMADNQLTSLAHALFVGISRPLGIQISGNPLVCDWSMCWLQYENNEAESITWILDKEPMCEGGRSWESYNWNCSGFEGNPVTRTPVNGNGGNNPKVNGNTDVIIGCVTSFIAGVLVTVAIAVFYYKRKESQEQLQNRSRDETGHVNHAGPFGGHNTGNSQHSPPTSVPLQFPPGGQEHEYTRLNHQTPSRPNTNPSKIHGNNRCEPRIHGNNRCEPRIHGNNRSEPRIHGNNRSEPRIHGNSRFDSRINGNNRSEPRLPGNMTFNTTGNGNTRSTSEGPGSPDLDPENIIINDSDLHQPPGAPPVGKQRENTREGVNRKPPIARKPKNAETIRNDLENKRKVTRSGEMSADKTREDENTRDEVRNSENNEDETREDEILPEGQVDVMDYY